MKPTLTKGQLTTWKDDRGFGFIQPADGGREIFLHISQLKDATRRPQVGDIIYYYAVTDGEKPRACDAFIVGARSKPTSTSSSNRGTSGSAHKAPLPVLEGSLLSILPLVGAIHFTWTTDNPLPLILYPVMSLLTFALYADDKSRAQRGRWRISEKTLHLCELAGGWLGGFVAQRSLCHKNRKTSYQTKFWAIVALHYIGWLGWLVGKSVIG